MLQFIERQLDDPELDAATLCRTFHCSRAQLYRHFKALGGVARHLQNRRLQRCFDQFTQGGSEHLAGRGGASSIGAVARRWSFDCPSHFLRLFKARFQMTRSDAQALGRVSSQEPEAGSSPLARQDLERFHRWLQRL